MAKEGSDYGITSNSIMRRQRHLHMLQKRQRHLQPLVQ